MSSLSIAAPCPSSPAAIRLAMVLVVAWLAAMAALLWHFELQRIAGSRQLLHFDTRDLPAPPAGAPAGVAKVLYFVDNGCRCNASTLMDIARIRDTATPLVRFVVGSGAATVVAADPEARPLSAAESARWQRHLPITPAAAVWDERDRLIYFGPINVNAGCGSERSYLQAALQNLPRQQGSAAAFQSWDVVVACTCPDVVRVRSVHS